MNNDYTNIILLKLKQTLNEFSEMPALAPYPDKGILQLFITEYDWYDIEKKIIMLNSITKQMQKKGSKNFIEKLN
ncbi:MAG: DUF1963 domain-containing protein [Tannerella sp.]|jgi:uncharacterized protein YwqG|nr:DUF1963 domain-containing protein [Tannerella sp.]